MIANSLNDKINSPEITIIFGRNPRRGGIPPIESILIEYSIL